MIPAKTAEGYEGYSKEAALASVGPGWAPLIDVIWQYKEAGKGFSGSQVDTPVTVNQVKEKFGGLRFYYSGGDDYFRGVVGAMEQMSYRMCEACGNPGGVDATSGTWLLTLCPICQKERNKGKSLNQIIEERQAHGNG